MFDKIRSYFNFFLKKASKNFTCISCGIEIPVLSSYYQNDKTGDVLCKDCFDEAVRKGLIK